MIEAAMMAARPISAPALAVLVALARMALRSKRGEADLFAALARSGVSQEPHELERALAELSDRGLLTRPVPMLGGGMLVVVSSEGSRMAMRHGLDETRGRFTSHGFTARPAARMLPVSAVMQDTARLVPA